VHTEFATSLAYQVFELTKRNTLSHCRDATYLVAKLLLNIASGLFIGFTFFKAKDSLHMAIESDQLFKWKLFVQAAAGFGQDPVHRL